MYIENPSLRWWIFLSTPGEKLPELLHHLGPCDQSGLGFCSLSLGLCVRLHICQGWMGTTVSWRYGPQGEQYFLKWSLIIQFGRVHFGVLSTPRFRPLILSSDWMLLLKNRIFQFYHLNSASSILQTPTKTNMKEYSLGGKSHIQKQTHVQGNDDFSAWKSDRVISIFVALMTVLFKLRPSNHDINEMTL